MVTRLLVLPLLGAALTLPAASWPAWANPCDAGETLHSLQGLGPTPRGWAVSVACRDRAGEMRVVRLSWSGATPRDEEGR